MKVDLPSECLLENLKANAHFERLSLKSIDGFEPKDTLHNSIMYDMAQPAGDKCTTLSREPFMEKPSLDPPL